MRKYKLKKKHVDDLEQAKKILLGVWSKFESSKSLAAYAAVGAVLEEAKESERRKHRRFLRVNRPFPLSTN